MDSNDPTVALKEGLPIACQIGSGNVRVLATPLMITLMERTCRLSVQPYLDEGFETVGTHVNVARFQAKTDLKKE